MTIDQDTRASAKAVASARANDPANDNAIRRQVERILEGQTFVGSKQLSKFLQFVVEEALAGRDADLKAYTIGVEVFGRGDDFDPQSDSIVRVEASRLRQKLREYYLTIGRNDDVVIDIPKGSYRPLFIVNGPKQQGTAKPSTSSRRANAGFPRMPVVLIAPPPSYRSMQLSRVERTRMEPASSAVTREPVRRSRTQLR